MTKNQKGFLWLIVAVVVLADAFWGPKKIDPVIYALLVLLSSYGVVRFVRTE